MNINIPPIECYIRKEYLYNLEKGHGELVEGTAFAIKSLQGNALLFSVMTDIGAVYDKIPISALLSFDKPKSEHIPFHILQLWDCFSYQPHVIQFMFLKGKRCCVMLKNGNKAEGIYRFTVDWSADMSGGVSTSYAEEPSQHKMAHIIELESGHFCAYPNNRILWAEPSMVADPFKTVPDYKLNMQKYHCESFDKWASDESDNYFYNISSISSHEEEFYRGIDVEKGKREPDDAFNKVVSDFEKRMKLCYQRAVEDYLDRYKAQDFDKLIEEKTKPRKP